METFRIGRVYTARSVCDHNCVFSFRIVSRSPKSITFDNGKRVKVRVDAVGDEWAMPLGTYSMAPILRASNWEK